jgi:Ras-related protein Rab-39B
MQDSKILERVVKKIIIVGPTEVGKTCLTRRYTEGRFLKGTKKTLGVDFVLKKITIPEDFPGNPAPFDLEITLQLWDFAGEANYRNVLPLFIRNTDCTLLCFDLSRPETLQELEDWLVVLKDKLRPWPPVILVGTKKDKTPIVSEEQISHFQAAQDIKNYVGTSAKKSRGIEDLFYLACKLMLQG